MKHNSKQITTSFGGSVTPKNKPEDFYQVRVKTFVKHFDRLANA